MSTKNNLTEEKIKELGFELNKTYQHDQYTTHRYKKGCIEVEFTYEKNKIKCIDATIDEIIGLPVNTEELQQIDTILNQ